ncbi:MAG: hypothetical protein IT384_23920 [Deltaproteobacteria bacterium]|nr:hypothetical protein [Deltaproteobacteria bacterium]
MAVAVGPPLAPLSIPETLEASAAIPAAVIETALGRSRDWTKLGASEADLAELDAIGQTGKTTAGARKSFEEYLNDRNDGFCYQVVQTRFDPSDLTERFAVFRMPK